VPPVAPALVERMRAGMVLRDATLVSLLAYAGVRPQEALALYCEDVGERSLLICAKVVDGERLPYTKTRRNRSVRLLAPLAQDLREYMLVTGQPGCGAALRFAAGVGGRADGDRRQERRPLDRDC
jgi:integrase